MTSVMESLMTPQCDREHARGEDASMSEMPWISSPSMWVHSTGWKAQSSYMSPGLIGPGWSSVTMPLCDSDVLRLVGGLGAQHGVEDVNAAAGQADQGGVVVLALAPFL